MKNDKWMILISVHERVLHSYLLCSPVEMVNLSRESGPSDVGEGGAPGPAEELHQHAEQTRDASKQ